MGDKTSIEWTDATWNPVTGCTKVSQGCKHCYAERVFPRAYGKDRTFTDVKCHPERLDQPLHWKKPRRIFVNSMSDLFHEAVPNSFIAKVFGIAALAQCHTFQILTKRPKRARFLLNDIHLDAKLCVAKLFETIGAQATCDHSFQWPLPNVHLLVSCEDQPTANERITQLLQTPAALRGVSLEPLLGPIDLTNIRIDHCTSGNAFYRGPFWQEKGVKFERGINWVIVGGESGPNARPMHPDWARSLRDQCVGADVPFFFKQHGAWLHESQFRTNAQRKRGLKSKRMEAGDGHQFVCVGKKKAGAMLDGRQWREFPT